jgi:hypothetical protein
MSTHVTELFAKASTLSDKDRATLAGLLIESLESETDPDVEEAWCMALLKQCRGKSLGPSFFDVPNEPQNNSTHRGGDRDSRSAGMVRGAKCSGCTCIVQELMSMVVLADRSPASWTGSFGNTRRIVFPHFPFSLVFRMKGETIEIVAIAHQRRRPQYWRDR